MIDAVVVGHGLPVLLVALDLAEVGLQVVVVSPDGVDADDAAWREPATVREPGPGVRDPDGVVTAALRRIAAPVDANADAAQRADSAAAHGAAAPEVVPPVPVWLRDPRGAWTPPSGATVIGIPAVPLAAQNLRLLGTRGAIRAYLDRITPLLTIGKTRTLGELVRRRLGATARDRLVAPLVWERFGRGPEEVDVAEAAPGLNEALTRAGSLTAAVLLYAESQAKLERRVAPAGGWDAAIAALRARLALFRVRFLAGTPSGIVAENGAWRMRVSGGSGHETVEFRALVMDAGFPAAREFARAEARDRALPPLRTRTYAEIGIERPADVADDGRFVAMVDLGDAGIWSLSAAADAGGAWRARVTGAARAADADPDADPDAVPAADSVATPAADPAAAPAAAPAAGVPPVPGARVLSAVGLSAVPGAEWAAGRVYAPFATLEERHRAEAGAVDHVLEVAASGADAESAASSAPLLLVGVAGHGGDLGAALGAADRAGVVLRRQLLGLQD